MANVLQEGDLRKQQGIYITEGLRIAEKEGFRDYLSGDLDIRDPYMKAQTAFMMNNVLSEYMFDNSIREDTMSTAVSGFIDTVFPVLRTLFPNSVMHDLVNVQALRTRNSQIFYMDYVVGRNKGGTYTRGQKLFDHRAGYPQMTDYTTTRINADITGTPAGGAAVFTGQCNEQPVVPNTIAITASVAVGTIVVLIDDGNGALSNTAGTVTGVLSYETGAFTLTSTVGNFDAVAVVASYNTSFEINDSLPQIDVNFMATSVTIEEQALRYRYSTNAAYDFGQEFGNMRLDDLLTNVMAQLISVETDYAVISDLWNMAGAAATNFSLTVPFGLTVQQHFGEIVLDINNIGAIMFLATQRISTPTWILCDANAGAVLATISAPIWQPVQTNQDILGIQKFGYLNGIPVYRDPLLQTLPGASALGNLLLGYRGRDWFDAPYVYAPYQAFTSTPETMLDDFKKRKASMTRYGRKRLYNLFYRIDFIP